MCHLHNGEYNFVVNADGFEIHTDVFIIDNEDGYLNITLSPLHTDDFLAESLLIYPNPFDELLYIESAAMVTKLVIMNLMGQVVLEKNIIGEDNLRMDVSHLHNGFYLVEIHLENGSKIVRKLLKQ